ncbi:hypothetical protein D8S78_03985 [Natrialba swarupiae]|nr:hypothetical protein [Natrialba swarupiae]
MTARERDVERLVLCERRQPRDPLEVVFGSEFDPQVGPPPVIGRSLRPRVGTRSDREPRVGSYSQGRAAA